MEMLATLCGKARPGTEPWTLTLGHLLTPQTAQMKCGFYHLSERLSSGRQLSVIEVTLIPKTQALEWDQLRPVPMAMPLAGEIPFNL